MSTQPSPISAPSVLLISGPTGFGKTSLIATAAKWLWQRHKKVLRLYTGDGGGYGTFVGALVKLGVIEVFRVRTRASSGAEGLCEETLALASRGYWPETFTSIEKGEVEPGVKMLAPITTTYRMSCPSGHLLKETTDHRDLKPIKCNTCQIAVTLQTAQVTKSSKSAEHMERVGGVAMEGLTSWSSWHLQSLSDRRARSELHGEQSNIGSFRSGDQFMDGNNRADYGFVQQAAERWLQNATTIQGLLIPPIFTALETAAEDTGLGPIWGPAIAGQAKTTHVPQWVGDYLGSQRVTNEKGLEEFRLYLTAWRSGDGRVHPYKPRAFPGYLPEYLYDKVGEEAFSGFNLGLYFDLLEQGEKGASSKLEKELGEVPGVRVQGKGKVEVGVAGAGAGLAPAGQGGAAPAQPTQVGAGAQVQAAQVQAGAGVKPVGRAPVPVRRAPVPVVKKV